MEVRFTKQTSSKNKMNTRVQEILEKPMDRRQFLEHLGMGILAIIGITSLLNLFLHEKPSAPSGLTGYGSSAYGK